MLRDDKLDGFLDVFWDEKSADSVDTDFWEEPQEKEKLKYLEYSDVMAVPKNKGKLPPRTLAAIFLIVVMIPVTIWVGIHFFNDRKYLLVSLVIVIYSMIPFFLTFESRKPQARELLIIAVLTAIAVAGRAAFFMVPSFKPVMAFVIISAVCFGAESGFLVGALSMLVSNMLFGQGPWTPWQMFSMGIIGFLAGILFQKGWLKARRVSLCIFGFWSALFIYGDHESGIADHVLLCHNEEEPFGYLYIRAAGGYGARGCNGYLSSAGQQTNDREAGENQNKIRSD